MTESTNERFNRLEDASIEASTQWLKTLLLLNGGACVVLVGFISSLATSEHLSPEFAPVIGAASRSFLCFAGGCIFVAVTWFIAYLTNQKYAKATSDPAHHQWSCGETLNAVGLVFAGLSLFFFSMGVINIACKLP